MKNSKEGVMPRLASALNRWAGSSWGFGTAVIVVLLWAGSGSFLNWSNTWQLLINTTTTIGTFMMVFLIQRTQNKDGMAIQLKLNELVAAIEGASNRLIDIEDLSEGELEILHKHYQRLVHKAREEGEMDTSHSLESADERHSLKKEKKRRR